jgi:hypothetical protein
MNFLLPPLLFKFSDFIFSVYSASIIHHYIVVHYGTTIHYWKLLIGNYCTSQDREVHC